jgi:hypothetical protein
MERILYDARQWRNTARQMRAVAADMEVNASRLLALALADGYDRLAERAERFAEGSKETARS